MKMYLGWLGLLSALAALTFWSAPTFVSAGDVRIMRLATLQPRTREGERGLREWNADLASQTGGAVQVRMYWGGISGDETTVIRKMKAGQLDGGIFSAVGLAQFVRSVLVLNAPGLVHNASQLDVLRKEFEPKFNDLFAQAGVHVSGWGEAGRVRVFSVAPIESPDDYRKVRPWCWTSDPVLPAYLKNAGAQGVSLSVPEVMGGLQTGMIDTVVASAEVVYGLQWYPKMKYMTEETQGFIVGALAFKTEAWEAFPPDVRKVMEETSRARNEKDRQTARDHDRKAFRALQTRGVKSLSTAKFASKWAEIDKKTRWELAGKIYPKAMLERAEQILANVDSKQDPL